MLRTHLAKATAALTLTIASALLLPTLASAAPITTVPGSSAGVQGDAVLDPTPTSSATPDDMYWQ